MLYEIPSRFLPREEITIVYPIERRVTIKETVSFFQERSYGLMVKEDCGISWKVTVVVCGLNAPPQKPHAAIEVAESSICDCFCHLWLPLSIAP